MILSILTSDCRKDNSSPSSASATARTDCETRVSCPMDNRSLSQRSLTVVYLRSSQASACLRASLLRSFVRSGELNPTVSNSATAGPS